MSKKVLVLAGSPRKHGNSDLLADAFIRGAQEAGHDTEKIYIKDKSVNGCLGCGACRRNGGTCVQKDDMSELYEKMMETDVIVLSSSVYFYTWTSQIKAVIDRTYAIEKVLTGKTFYLIGAGAAPEEKYMEIMLDSFRRYIACFRGVGNREGGHVFGLGTGKSGDVVGTPAMEQAYMLGRSIEG